MEVDFDTLAELETFWASIPQQEHKAWSERARVGSLVPGMQQPAFRLQDLRIVSMMISSVVSQYTGCWNQMICSFLLTCC